MVLFRTMSSDGLPRVLSVWWMPVGPHGLKLEGALRVVGYGKSVEAKRREHLSGSRHRLRPRFAVDFVERH